MAEELKVSQLSAVTFNTPLEMPWQAPKRHWVLTYVFFQYSIGDAILSIFPDNTCGICGLSILHWRCAMKLWPRCPQCDFPPFNTPLEMPHLATPSPNHTATPHFQYSIGDAGYKVHSNDYYVKLLSILHWRCHRQSSRGLHPVVQE